MSMSSADYRRVSGCSIRSERSGSLVVSGTATDVSSNPSTSRASVDTHLRRDREPWARNHPREGDDP